MKYKGIIFDLDGVICHTDEYHYQAWKHLANMIGVVDFNREDNKYQRGVSRMESLEVVLRKSSKQYTQEEKIELANIKNDYYIKLLNNMSPSDLSSDVKEALVYLKENNYKIAIGSSSKNTPLILSKLGLDNFFDKVCDGNMITKSKPDPEVFLKAQEMLGLEVSECLVVEDAVSGAQAANRGGFDCAGILEASNCEFATYSINSLLDLIKIV